MSGILIVARHCQTKLNYENRIQGANHDYELNEFGTLQAKNLAQKLSTLVNSHEIDKIYTSNSKRAIQTASAIGNNIFLDNRLLPYDVGTADGKKFDKIINIKRFPIPLFYKNMENFFGYLKRTKNVLKDLLLECENKVVVVVTHEDISAMFEKMLMKKSYLSVPNIGLNNGEFRLYKIDNYNKKNIYKGKFFNIGVKKVESKNLFNN